MYMKMISWNVNGIRAVERKEELARFIDKHAPDVFFIQETKSQPDQVTKIIEAYPQYAQYYHSAEKKGYASVAAWVHTDLGEHTIHVGMPGWEDTEGRVIRVDIGDWSLFGVYFPNGGKSPEAWEEKLEFYEHFLGHVEDLRKKGRKVLWSGDVNCAHEEIDIARPKDNEGKIGFHPKERAWVSKCVEAGWVDLYRDRNPDAVMYSWWHLISRARARNVGWRIDYIFAHEEIASAVSDIWYDNDQMGSDHCPVGCEFTL
jgi:exodeoxyribonuclease-3